MLQQDGPADYIVATGQTHSVEELVACAFEAVGLDWREYVRSDERQRGALRSCITWSATPPGRGPARLGATVTFEELVRLLVAADLAELRAGAQPAATAVDVLVCTPRAPR